MAYGNLPGGGFSGYIKAKQPLVIEKPSSLPLTKLPEEQEDAPKDRRRMFWKRKRLEKLDEKPGKEYTTKPRRAVGKSPEKRKQLKEPTFKRVDEEVEKLKARDQISYDRTTGVPEFATRQKEPEKKSKDFFRGILKRKEDKARKVGTERRRSVTFDDKGRDKKEDFEEYDEAREEESDFKDFPEEDFEESFAEKVDEGLEDFTTEREDEISDDRLAEDPEFIARQTDEEFDEEHPEKEHKKKSRGFFRGILKRKDKDTGRKDVTERRSVTFDDKELERYDEQEGEEQEEPETIDDESLEKYSEFDLQEDFDEETDDEVGKKEQQIKPFRTEDEYEEEYASKEDYAMKDEDEKLITFDDEDTEVSSKAFRKKLIDKGKGRKGRKVREKSKKDVKIRKPKYDKKEKSKAERTRTASLDKEFELIEIPEEDEITSAKDDVAIDIEGLEDSLFQPVEDEDVSNEELQEVPDTAEPEIRVKFWRPKRTPTYTHLKRKRSIIRFSPCVDHLLYSKRMEYRGLKAMLGFPIGALFGFALYWIVLHRIGAEHYYCWLLGTIVGSGFAISTQVRCICFLSIPSSCGRAGRAFISTYAVAYLLEGPLANVLNNSREAMRSISCTAALNLNHTVERFKLMFKPVKEIVVDFVKSGQNVQDDTKQLENAFVDIEKEVRDEDELKESIEDTKQLDDEIGGESRVDLIKKKFGGKRKKTEFGEVSEKKYGMKSEFRCEGVFNKGVRACYDSFEKAYDRCHSYLPIIGYLLCWPMKLTFICDLASSLIGKRACDSAEALNPGFGASVDTADGVQSEFDEDFAVQLQYKLTIPDQKVDQLTPEDVSGAMKYSFERRKRNLEFFSKLVDRILAILCLLVINSSRKYCNRYLRVIQFDNKYVTSYFRHIDARRHRDGKLILLPLKKGEKVELSDPFSVKLSAEEKMKLIVSGLRLISEILTVSILLVFDRVFFEFLDLVKRHAHVTYKQSGVHHIKMTVFGDGFVANMVRGILKGFDKKHTTDQVTTTEECLPLPTKLPQEIIIRLYLVFVVMLVLIIVESYASRLRRAICAFFYPKREKKRIIFLYNDRLKKRRSFLQYMKRQVRKQAREQAIQIDSGVFFTLRKFYPKYFNWVSKFGLGLERCLICGESESRKSSLIRCPGCPFSYCAECWQDTEGKCYVCIQDDDTEPSDDETTSDEE